tara:strand:- start:1625 stop:1930 length:306 start_codon:yes stop_codon:yes gene_type:complete
MKINRTSINLENYYDNILGDKMSNEFTDTVNKIAQKANERKEAAKPKPVEPVVAKQKKETVSMLPMDLAENKERPQPNYSDLDYPIGTNPSINKNRTENKY